jgi:hypothetical protein
LTDGAGHEQLNTSAMKLPQSGHPSANGCLDVASDTRRSHYTPCASRDQLLLNNGRSIVYDRRSR